MKLASCKSALNLPVVYSTDRSKAVVPVLVLLFVALWLILPGDLFYVLPCVITILCFSVVLALRLLRLRKRGLIFVLVWFNLFSSLCLGSAAVCDCGILWTFSYLCFIKYHIDYVDQMTNKSKEAATLDFSLTFIFLSII